VERLRLLSGELGPAQRDDLHNRSLPRRNFSNASRNAFSPIGAAITSFLRLPSGSFVSAYGLVIAASGPRRLRGEPADHQLQLAVLKGRDQRLLAADDAFNLCLQGSGELSQQVDLGSRRLAGPADVDPRRVRRDTPAPSTRSPAPRSSRGQQESSARSPRPARTCLTTEPRSAATCLQTSQPLLRRAGMGAVTPRSRQPGRSLFSLHICQTVPM
jgi:hypothetical protein